MRISSCSTRITLHDFMKDSNIVDRIQAKHMETLADENKDIMNPQFDQEIISDEGSEGWMVIRTHIVIPPIMLKLGEHPAVVRPYDGSDSPTRTML